MLVTMFVLSQLCYSSATQDWRPRVARGLVEQIRHVVMVVPAKAADEAVPYSRSLHLTPTPC